MPNHQALSGLDAAWCCDTVAGTPNDGAAREGMEGAQGRRDSWKCSGRREVLGWIDRNLADNGESRYEKNFPYQEADIVAHLYQALHAYGRKVCMDSTHNTGRGFNGEKIYLYTLVLRNKQTGGLTPGAWMLSNSEQQ